ncbi:DgyrCDS1362 [Dimorphilus gyrociliatus]|uniref:DgyrCDS1362 n=1 Tax=Dimorphilus gyrociliatus TaxID=2664684 RepID=A0A7I8VC57_9ANNE|nr:DgyrCDS1362 [Dimorphilus gyrociliatus]
MEIIVGTYEELLLAYNLVDSDKGFTLQQSFTNHNHTGCIKCLNVSKNDILVSGSTDETIQLINLKSRKETGSLMEHSGTVTSLNSFDDYLISSSEDGSICIWDVKSWQCLKTLKKHKSAVFDVAIHPSGKLAISCGKDNTLRTWDLTNGKCAFVINTTAASLKWNETGKHYIAITGNKIDTYEMETGKKTTTELSYPICSSLFISETELLVGGEGGHLEIIDLISGEKRLSIDSQMKRVKCLTCSLVQEGPNNPWIIAGSSDGMIKIFRLDKEGSTWSSSLVAKHDTKFRLTCIAIRETGPVSCESDDSTE